MKPKVRAKAVAHTLRGALAVLVVAGALQVTVPLGAEARAWLYVAVALAAVMLAAVGVIVNRPSKPLAWNLIVAGFAGWAVADTQWTIEQFVTRPDGYPVISDAIYLPSYLVVAAGLGVMLWLHRGAGLRAIVLDGAVIATGVAVFVTSVLVVPLTRDHGLNILGVVVSVAYPIADAVLLVITMLLWATPAVRSRSLAWLFAALIASFVPDMAWATFGHQPPQRLADATWLAVYVLLACATIDPTMKDAGQPSTSLGGVERSSRRLALLAVGLAMPVFVAVLRDPSRGVTFVEGGTLLVSMLILARMGDLMKAIRGQADRLATLADFDWLTGAPNRRTWDRELWTACRDSRSEGTPLSVALLDLDRFKAFNDQHGHHAGDLLLQEAVIAWNGVLADRGVIARYGGEEFAVLLPRHDLEAALSTVRSLRSVTPRGQSFSAGVTLWDPTTEPNAAMIQADRGLYDAKRTGRDRIVVVGAQHPSATQP